MHKFSSTAFFLTLTLLLHACLPSLALSPVPTLPPQHFRTVTVHPSSALLQWAQALNPNNGQDFRPGRLSLVTVQDVTNLATVADNIPMSEYDGTGGTAYHSYVADSTFGLGESTSPDRYVVYANPDSAVTITGLTPNHTYQARVYAYNNNSTASSVDYPTYYAGNFYNLTPAELTFTTPAAALTPLPVVLTSFTGKLASDNHAHLAWTTASEANSRAFVVERSADGRAFSAVGRVAAAGSTTQARAYSLIDKEPLNALGYYRLRQIDLDSTSYFSPVVALQPKQAAGGPRLTVWPTPAEGSDAVHLQLEGLSDFSQPVTVLVYAGSTGQLVSTMELPAAPLTTEVVNINEWAAGSYFVRAIAAEGQWHARLVVQ